jgi:hypothetical protein
MYVNAPVHNDRLPMRGLADIGNDRQNVHRNEVTQDTDRSVIRLYQRYAGSLNTSEIIKRQAS